VSAPSCTRNISCIKGDKTIDQPINGHVSFMGKNGVKGSGDA
jgi:conjugal transfer pilus assembly protein TraB